jgi:multidrug efflux pump subunit AcrA (membrane-fusion protein)
MSIKAIYSTIEEVPEQYVDLFTERNGQYELNIEGVKTSADVERLQTAISNERASHKDTKSRYSWVGELTSSEVQSLRDAQEDLQHQLETRPAAMTDEQVEERAEKLAGRQTRQLERSLVELQTERDSYATAISLHEAAANQRKIRDAVDDALSGSNALSVVEGAREDIIPFAERVMTVQDGRIVSKEGVGFEPGLPFGEVLADLKATGKRGHWFPGNTGAGANGSAGAGANLGTNPFASDNMNLTEIGKVVNADPAKAKALAKAAGVDPAKFGL